ncbi:MAG: hypothetical protein ABR910_13300 [Acidobacteriaceae bacterium]
MKILAIVIVAATMYSLIGCAAPATFNYSNVTISLNYTSCAANCIGAVEFNPASPTTLETPGPSNNGCVNIFATVTNAPANVTYTLYPTPSLVIPTLPSGTGLPLGEQASPVGTVNYANGTTNFYCITNTLPVPIYKGAALQQAQAMGIPQGDVLLIAGVPNNPNTPSSSCVLPTSPGCATFSQLIQLYNNAGPTGPPTLVLFPSDASGYTTSVATVTHGTQFQFNGFAVGAPPCLSVTACLINGTPYAVYSTDNKVNWFVGPTSATAVLGGSSTYGTISSSGLYTAPAAVPPSPPVIVMESDLVTTVTAIAYITVN